jgi:hypothetical protein
MAVLQHELGWEYYGSKHHESIYTRFYQGYILPRKFGVDKRYGHLSDLIKAGQITREQALEQLRKPPYPQELQQQDVHYVCKKLGFSRLQFEQIMNADPRTFGEYRNSYERVEFMRNAVNWLRGKSLYPR